MNDIMDRINQPNIKIYLRETDDFLCKVEIVDNHITVTYGKEIEEVEKKILEEYFNENIPKWEVMKFTVNTGGQTTNGGTWSGKDVINIQNNPGSFLPRLSIEMNRNDKKKRFNMKYIFSYERTIGLDITSLK